MGLQLHSYILNYMDVNPATPFYQIIWLLSYHHSGKGSSFPSGERNGVLPYPLWGSLITAVFLDETPSNRDHPVGVHLFPSP